MRQTTYTDTTATSLDSNTVSFTTAVRILEYHGYKPNQQTAALKGAWVDSGTSFLETFGIADTYNRKAIMIWLGY